MRARRGTVPPEELHLSPLVSEPVIVVRQKPKVFEFNSRYDVFDGHDRPIGRVRQTAPRGPAKPLQLLEGWTQVLDHRLQIEDASGRVVLRLTRPAKFMKSRVILRDGQGVGIGQVVQQNVARKVALIFEVGGEVQGSISAIDLTRRAFQVLDGAGVELARLTKTKVGFAKELFTTADNYRLEVPQPVPAPMGFLVLAAPIVVDVALHQFGAGL